jgi:hypothetical protein
VQYIIKKPHHNTLSVSAATYRQGCAAVWNELAKLLKYGRTQQACDSRMQPSQAELRHGQPLLCSKQLWHLAAGEVQ